MKFLALSSVAIAVSAGVLVYAFAGGGEKRNARWAAFKSAHHCHLIEQWSGDAGTMEEHHKVTYLCDDGVRYYR